MNGTATGRDWRGWPQRVAAVWRRSLQFRTIAITLGMSMVAVLVTGVYLSTSVSANLFSTRLGEVQLDASRSMDAAELISDASDASDRAGVQLVVNSLSNTIGSISSSEAIAMYRVPGQAASAAAPQDFAGKVLQQPGVISDELQAQVRSNRTGEYWQSVSILDSSGATQPGIVVGAQLQLPSAGWYEVYLAYSLADVQQTLAFVQQTAFIAALFLLLLLGVVAWVVVRFVVRPIRVAADTSQKLASGDLAVRIPERGEDVLATLARSFNGMADSLQAQIKELAELSEVQQRFVSDVSHELRTPLTTIRLAGDVLYDQRSSFTPAGERTAELLHAQIERFELLLTDLLEISRYDAGSVELATEPTNLAVLAADAIESMHTLADGKGIPLRLSTPGGHTAVAVDPRRIRRILRNLLGNAIEHGEGRPVVVTVDSTASAVGIGVRDYGVGMTETEVSHVFDRFWRADPSRQRTIGGTGLGLAISLEDAVAHGGRLEVWSRRGAGSNFVLTLPRSPGELIGAQPVPVEPDDAGAAGPIPEGPLPEGAADVRAPELIGGADA